MAIILVLDDDPERVRWLHQAAKGHEIIHCTRVLHLRHVSQCTNPDLIILDHDLSGTVCQDVDGYDGCDAARTIRVPDGCPVIVWSWNIDHAKLMVKMLQDRGVKAAQAQFGAARVEKLIQTVCGYRQR